MVNKENTIILVTLLFVIFSCESSVEPITNESKELKTNIEKSSPLQQNKESPANYLKQLVDKSQHSDSDPHPHPHKKAISIPPSKISQSDGPSLDRLHSTPPPPDAAGIK